MTCVVIGAGVIGLSVAKSLLPLFKNLYVLEKEDSIGTGTSSRNSEVIHAGIYYPKNSLKAELCLRGRNLLYKYCSENGIPHRRCGKLVVSNGSPIEMAKLREIEQMAVGNDVNDVVWLNKDDIKYLEPQIEANSALLSPSTGIVDSHALMYTLLAEMESNGGTLSLKTEVINGRIEEKNRPVIVTKDLSFGCDYVVNCSGLFAENLVRNSESLIQPPILTYAKGNYFSLQKSIKPFQRLIYPIPEEGGLGIHATLDLSGRVKFGPDVEWTKGPPFSYTVDAARSEKFYLAIKKYWPEIENHTIVPDYAGIRPKCMNSKGDFEFINSHEKWLNCYGIESPGLTASLAIGEYVADMVKRVIQT